MFWDGAVWRPIVSQPPVGYAQPPAPRKSALPACLIGCGIALVVVILIGVVGFLAIINNAGFQRSFCNSFTSSDPNQICPFSPSAP
jgi:hypothetical protein